MICKKKVCEQIGLNELKDALGGHDWSAASRQKIIWRVLKYFRHKVHAESPQKRSLKYSHKTPCNST